MAVIEFGRRRITFFVVAVLLLVFLIGNVFFTDNELRDRVSKIPIPGRPSTPKPPIDLIDPDEVWDGPEVSVPSEISNTSTTRADLHPIARLMQEADAAFRLYEGSRSRTFRNTVDKYRSRYGRHPPPGFKEWYKFARKRNVFNIDDFDQVMDDLRPFWAVSAADIRAHAAHMWENPEHGLAVIHIRNHKVVKVHNDMWRTEVMEGMIKPFIEHLPDMDIPMNRMDQPRVVVPWEKLQEMLENETTTRVIPPDAMDSFTSQQTYLWNISSQSVEEDNSTRLDAGWFNAPGQQYMKIAHKACPPESPARMNSSTQTADAMYKEPLGGFINNFNLSSDLCTVGPIVQDLHGMLYSASSIMASHTLVPVFGECKVSVNNDILFPANMYYKHDQRYDYSPEEDLPWKEKSDTMIWRGVTSGGTQIAENWQTMHRQRLVQLFNGTYMRTAAREVDVLSEKLGLSSFDNITYEDYNHFQPSQFADKHSDIGFVEAWGCVPDCSFYDTVFSWKPQTTLSSQFRHKYLVDVDGHSFSGRWHAFLQSKSLGFKATIFREWHDSRLFAWRHFVPVDNRYDDLYSLLTYFIGYNPESDASGEPNPTVHVAPHPVEAKKMARQGREWANKVLRRDDIEVYMFRLLLEYGRIIDDNRDRIGYSGDGTELDEVDNGLDQEFGSWWTRFRGNKNEDKPKQSQDLDPGS